MSFDDTDPYVAIAAVAVAIHEHLPPTPAAALEELIGKTIHHLPAVDHVGVAVVVHREHQVHVRTAVATSERAQALHTIAGECGEGPPQLVATTGTLCQVEDLTTEQRWPRFRDDALARTTVRSILAYPLFATRAAAGVLTVSADTAGAFDQPARDLARVLAAHASILWTAAGRADQFQQALASRDMIGQAKGILMERYSLGPDAAFALLKSLSQDANVRLADIARRLVDLEHPD